MKIALFHNLYGIYSHGGAETAVEMMIDDFKKNGAEVFLITTKPRGDKPEESALKIYYLNSRFYNLGKTSPFYRFFWQLANLFSISKYFRIKKILREEKPDLIITHNLMGLGFMAPLAGKKLKIRHEHFLHDIQLIHPSGLMIWGKEKKIDGAAAKIYQFFTRRFFSSAAKVISPSRWLLELHSGRGFFAKADKEVRPFKWELGETGRTDRKDGKINFLFIGQLEQQKGIFLLIDTFKKISDPRINLTIVIRNNAGKTALAKKAAQGDGRIKFLGPLDWGTQEKVKKNSDCLIIPSLCYENSPTTIYGAHAAGLSVIASNIGGIPEIISEKDKLFKPGDAEDLRKKITEFIG